MKTQRKRIIIVLILAVVLFTAYRFYNNRLSKNIGAVSEYAIGAVSSSISKSNSNLLFFNEDLDLTDKKEIHIGSLSSEYSVPLRDDEGVYIPNTGETNKEDISMVHFDPKTGDVNYYKDPKEIGMIDTLFKTEDKMYNTSNINNGCSLTEMSFNGSEEKVVSIENALIGNGGKLGEELFLITHSTPVEGGTNKDGTAIVFYNDNLEKLREFHTDKFVHRGPSVVYNDKIYFMSSNQEAEDKRIFSVNSRGDFEEIPLKCWIYRIEPTSQGLLLAGEDEKAGAFILLNEKGEQLHYRMEEDYLVQMKWQDDYLYTLDSLENGERFILRKYEFESDEMKVVREKEIEFKASGEIIRSLF